MKKSLTPNNFGKIYLIDECPKIKIKDFVKKYKEEIKKLLIESELKAMGENIELTTSKTNYNGLRFWFKCPICHKRAGVLYKRPLNNQIGCRKCLNLDYRKHRYKGMAEELAK